MTEPLALVVLAAGAGRRYGGLKQLAPVGPRGEALLEYSVHDALLAGFSRVVLVVGADGEGALRRRFGRGMARAVPLAYVRQELSDLPDGCAPPAERLKPWGTAHAVLAAHEAVRGPFAVINADDFYGRESFAALARFLMSPTPDATLAMVGFEVGRTVASSGPVSRALCRLDGGDLLLEIEEIESVWRQNGRIAYRGSAGSDLFLAGSELVSMNMWGFTPDVFPALRRRFETFLTATGDTRENEFLLPDVVQSWVRNGTFAVRVLRGGADWCGITFREDQRRVAEILAAQIGDGRYPEELWR